MFMYSVHSVFMSIFYFMYYWARCNPARSRSTVFLSLERCTISLYFHTFTSPSSLISLHVFLACASPCLLIFLSLCSLLSVHRVPWLHFTGFRDLCVTVLFEFSFLLFVLFTLRRVDAFLFRWFAWLTLIPWFSWFPWLISFYQFPFLPFSSKG